MTYVTSDPSGQRGVAGSAYRMILGNEILLVLIAFAVLASILSPTFLTEINIRNVLNQASIIGILACAQFLVVLIGGFDLSVAAVMALSSVIFASIAPTSIPLGMAAALAAGGALGLLNGIAITLGRVTPLIATLGVMGIARGFAFVVSEKSVSVPRNLLAAGRNAYWIFSVPVITWFIIALVLAWVLTYTRFGRNLYAIGGNERSARLAGIPVIKREIAVYGLSGLLSALAGLLLVMRTSSGVPHVGEGWELDAIAAIVIGGARLFGGEGNILKAMLGVIIYQMIANVMNLAGLDPFYQDIVKAVVIVVVVSISVMRSRRSVKG